MADTRPQRRWLQAGMGWGGGRQMGEGELPALQGAGLCVQTAGMCRLGGLQTESPSPYELVVFSSLNLFILTCDMD